ncbi:hypothetical protein GCM10023258_00090 [Terrabacter aeriphilus]|uniref:UDP-N-acetylmuramyl pentapeptide phosphotransferase/UDP-N-acetylglucosamine-1-phosphate transferase n=2 Tax=Terrabacter aeriphilus TaxID=515662 RepID=A0ABP9IZH5_9MICO
MASALSATAPSTVPSAVTVATLVGAAVASAAALRLARRLPETARAPWERTNHAGRPVTLLEGPAVVAGAVTGAAVAGAVTRARSGARPDELRSGAPTTVVALAAGALGALDDLAGGVSDKGLKGHLGALARGEVTTGALKVVGLGLTGLAGAALADSRAARTAPTARTSRPRSLAATLVGGAVVAGAANAVNLFDLRPGRALKVTVAAALPLVTATPAAAVLGASLGVARDDLEATAMLGDTGANAAGALLGLALVERTGLAGRTVALTGLVALTLASERVSFTRVIESHPTLRRLDEWGRERR